MSHSMLLESLEQLSSEGRNPNSMQLDQLNAQQIVTLMNQEDATVTAAIAPVLPAIALAAERVANAFSAGGRLIYIGAGTSGRLGVLDASECPPTFGVPATQVVGIIAGGDTALRAAIEGAEDNAALGAEDLKRHHVTARDVVVGIAASGRTPYVIGALNYARQLGCVTVALACNANAPIAERADIAILPVVGPEVLSGSTRLKSGTAQKLVLNMISTTSMVLMGKTYQNLMVDVKATNEKLIARAIRIVMQATSCTEPQALAALQQADFEVKAAILMQLTGLPLADARQLLSANAGFLNTTLTHVKS